MRIQAVKRLSNVALSRMTTDERDHFKVQLMQHAIIDAEEIKQKAGDSFTTLEELDQEYPSIIKELELKTDVVIVRSEEIIKLIKFTQSQINQISREKSLGLITIAAELEKLITE